MDEVRKEVKIGDTVTYKDELGADHNALVNAVHSQECINVVYLSEDETKRDSWGRQTEHQSSVQRQGPHTAHGRYFVA